MAFEFGMSVEIDRVNRCFKINGVPRPRSYLSRMIEWLEGREKEFVAFLDATKFSGNDFDIPLESDGRMLLSFRKRELSARIAWSPYGSWHPTAADMDRICEEWKKHRDKVVGVESRTPNAAGVPVQVAVVYGGRENYTVEPTSIDGVSVGDCGYLERIGEGNLGPPNSVGEVVFPYGRRVLPLQCLVTKAGGA